MFKKTILACCLSAFIQCSAALEPSFEIKRYAIENASLISSDELVEVVAPHTGEGKTIASIQAAMAAIEEAYSRRGYGAVKAILPEQDLEDGVVRVKVVEAKVGQVEVVGNRFFSTENVLRTLPSVEEGKSPNLRAIDASLRVANESAAKQTNVIFRSGSDEGAVDVSIRVADENPLRFALYADNTGTPDANGDYTTGRARTGLIVQHANLFDRDHAASFQYITSPDHLSDVTIIGVGYRIPLYAWGDSLEFAFGYSNVDSGKLSTVAGPIGISGSGQVYLARYDQMLPRWGDWLAMLSYGLDYRIYTNNAQVEGSDESLIPDATVHPVSLTYGGRLAQEGRVLLASLTYAHNIPGGENGTTEDFTQPGGRAGATANYQLWRYNANLTQSLPADWLARLALNGQYTADALISGEQYGVGGQDSVRGFYEREFANDSGYRWGAELHTPNLFGGADLRTRALVFYDAGHLSRNKAQPGEVERISVSSWGLGLRGGAGKQFNYRIDYGIVLDGAGTTKQGDSRLHASMMVSF